MLHTVVHTTAVSTLGEVITKEYRYSFAAFFRVEVVNERFAPSPFLSPSAFSRTDFVYVVGLLPRYSQ